MSDHKFVATLVSTKRLANSANGNPRYQLETDTGTYRTKTDGMVGYLISGYLVGKRLEFTVNGRGQVWDINTTDGSDL